jgi:hypothetical protein
VKKNLGKERKSRVWVRIRLSKIPTLTNKVICGFHCLIEARKFHRIVYFRFSGQAVPGSFGKLFEKSRILDRFIR